MEYDGAELGNITLLTPNNEAEGEVNVCMGQSSWNQICFEDQNNQTQIRPSIPQLTKGKGNIFIIALIY